MAYDDTDVSDQPIKVSETGIGCSEGRNLAVQMTYTPPLDGSVDLYEGIDMQFQADIADILNRKYFGYDWKGYSNVQQGIVGFSIPELMGATLHFVINLHQFSDLTPELITRCGGDLLERMNLPRDRFRMWKYLEAKNNMDKFDFGKVQ